MAKAKNLIASLGPGLISGAADDDPSGIGTYTIAGSKFGNLFLWTALLTWPLMSSVQMACAKVAIVTGKGLAEAFSLKLKKPILYVICVALILTNILNIAADLLAMGDAVEILVHIPIFISILILATVITWGTVKFKYSQIVRVLKYLTLSLFSYIFVAFFVHAEWLDVLKNTFLIRLPTNGDQWSMLVAILGTTITPFLFFWQASQEVEELQKTKSLHIPLEEQLSTRRQDVWIGGFFSNLVMFFVILSSSLTLFKNGMTDIETSRQAAEALIPLAGKGAFLLYSLGILGVGFLAIPPLVSSGAYTLCETLHQRRGLNREWFQAKAFYGIIVGSMIIAVLLGLARLNPLKMLYWSAVLNGLLAPVLLIVLWFVVRDPIVMKGHCLKRSHQVGLGIAILLMSASAIGMFIF